MKFTSLVRNAMATGLSATLALGLSACSRDYVAAYVYATNNNGSASTISAYAVDYQSGILTQISGSPFALNFTNPLLSIPSPNNRMLYTVSGSQDNKVEVWSIGTDGKLYAQATPSLTGTYPTGAAIDSTGTFLYVSYQRQTTISPTASGPGGLTYFPVNNDGSLGTAVDVPVGAPSGTAPNIIPYPVGVTVTVPVSTNNNAVYVYVAEQLSPQANTTGATSGVVMGYVRNANGSLTSIGSYTAGVNPSAIISDPTGRFVYVTDKTSNQVIGYEIMANGALLPLVGSPYATGLRPVAMTIDPRGKYLYTVNYNSGNVSGFTIKHADGSLGSVVGTSAFTTATGPTCVVVDPSVGDYLYTSNYLDGSISGAKLTPEDGTLKSLANSPFPAGTNTNCVTAVANGSHADSIVYPQ